MPHWQTGTADLAATLPAIISQAQIDYMLAQRYAVPALQAEIGTAGHWLDGLWLAEHERVRQLFSARRPGSNEARQAVSASGVARQGLGSLLQYVAARARQQGCTTLQLAVNKRNRLAIRAYQRNGFSTRRVDDTGHRRRICDG